MSVNVRRVPSEWPELLGKTEDILIQAGGATVEAVMQTASMISDMPSQNLDAVRYYGLTNMLGEMSDLLSDGTVRGGVIDISGSAIARDVVSSIKRARSSPQPQRFGRLEGLLIRDLKTSQVTEGFEPVIDDSFGVLGPAEQLLNGALRFVANRRHAGRSEVATGTKTGDVLAAAVTDEIKTVAMSSTLTATDYAFHARYDLNPGMPQPVKGTWLRQIPLKALMAELSSVHLDRFQDTLTYVQKTDDNTVRVNPEHMRNPATRMGRNSAYYNTLHTKALGCPALHIVGFIPLMAATIPDIVDDAAAKIQAQI